jgi:hypothetical protein
VRPPRFRPEAGFVVAAGLDELQVLAVGDRDGVDEERLDVDDVGRPLVVVGERVPIGPHDELPAGDEDLGHQGWAARRGRGGDVGIRGGHQLQRGQHRLVMLVLVLDHHPVHEALVEQRDSRVELHPVEDVEHAAADHGDMAPGLRRAEDGQLRPLPADVAEGVVDVVVGWVDRPGARGCPPDGACAGDRPEQPQLLVVADVGQVPHQGRHQRGVLRHLVGVGEGLQEVEGPPPGDVERAGQPLLQSAHAPQR